MHLQYKSFENTMGKEEVSTFPTVFSSPFGELYAIFIKLNVLSANYFSLEQFKILLFGKKLTIYLICQF